MNAEMFELDKCKVFARSLFELLLMRTKIGDEELDYWSFAIYERQDFVWAMQKFVESDEYRSIHYQKNKTEYPSGHFYSPVVDVSEISQHQEVIFSVNIPPGIDLRSEDQVRMFVSMVPLFDSLPYTKSTKLRYNFDNTSFGIGDAHFYWAMLGLRRPGRVIEVGSGYTSALLLDAIDVLEISCQAIFIDPFPGLLLDVAKPMSPPHQVLDTRVQDVSLQIFDLLSSGDILFIDSSHVFKTGSDVHFIITQILPRLKKGVFVHFHDCFYPFEYPRKWVIEDNKSWNELYVLQVLLQTSERYRIVFFNDYFAKVHQSVLVDHMPETASQLLVNPGGGLWLEVVTEP